MQQATSIWGKMCELIRPKMAVFSFDIWIKVLTPFTVMDHTLVLLAPSEIVQSTIERNYSNLLLEYAAHVRNDITEVRIILEEEKQIYLQQQPEVDPSMLNPKYTFNTFVVGNSNHFAHAVALAVAQNPAHSYNPLFLYGGVGLGKTHLMHAIGHFVKEHDPNCKVMYVTSETFTNEMIQSISSNRNKEFRNKYRNVNLLMVDDIQFIAKKEGVQEEFFHTFNTLYNADKQIVISSDKPPRKIAQLEERLRTRFEQGLIADIQPPDYETRMAILKRKANQDQLDVDDKVLEFIAERVLSNIRELEGSLTRVIAFAQINRREIDIHTAEEALKYLLPGEAKRALTPDFIKDVVADFYGIDPNSLNAKRRDQEVAFPRQVAMYLCRNMLDIPLAKIGESFGGRNHTTVMHADDKISELLHSDASLSTAIEDIKKRLRE